MAWDIIDTKDTAKERKARQKEKIAWYIKWFSSIIVMFAMAMRATGEPQLAVWDLYLSTVGIFGWLIVSLLWKVESSQGFPGPFSPTFVQVDFNLT